MAGNIVKKNIAEIADMLSLKQKNNQNMVLFLGSRAGGLFRSQDFIETMKKYSKRNFDLLSREGQFAECFNVLKQKNFNDNNIHALLTEFLKPVTFSESDIYLAEFIKRGAFDVIITANIDSLLEKALVYVGMKDFYDFVVRVPGDVPVKTDKMPARLVIKVFGDIYSRGYNVTKRDFYLDYWPDLKILLEQTLTREVLVIGFDPTWDAEVLRVFTDDEQENFLWLVTEEEALIKHTLVSRTLRRRQTGYLTGKIGGYEQFLKALYVYLYDKMPAHHQLMHEIRASLELLHSEVKSLHHDVQALRKEFSVAQKKLNPYSDNSDQE
jgi:hypothetical protein